MQLASHLLFKKRFNLIALEVVSAAFIHPIDLGPLRITPLVSSVRPQEKCHTAVQPC